MKEIFQKKLESVKSLEERAALKELVEKVLLPMAEYQERQWESIKSRVFDEARSGKAGFQIVTGLCDKAGYDPALNRLFPILPQEEPDLSAISKALAQSEPIELFSVYLDEKRESLRTVFSEERLYDAELRTDKSVVKASCKLIYDTRYLDALKSLHKSFVRHGLTWRTVQTAYFDRMARVVLMSWNAFPEGEELREIDVKFENLTIRHTGIPLWNVETLSMKARGFALSFEDESLYEHRIHIADTENLYLAVMNDDIRSVKRTPHELILRTDIAKSRMWEIYKIVDPQCLAIDREPPFPLFSNARTENFTAFVADGTSIFTDAEIMRRIESFGLPLTVKDIRITDEKHPNEICGTMNFALDDAFSRINDTKALLVSFDAGSAGVLASYAADTVCFLMSELQMKYPQYRCAGVLS